MVYKKQGHPDVVCAIPRRLEMAQEKGLLIVAHATHKLKEIGIGRNDGLGGSGTVAARDQFDGARSWSRSWKKEGKMLT